MVVPDLRGMGLSSHPEGGYEKKTQAGDIARVLDKLKIDKADLVTHDIGNMVGYAFAAQYPDASPAGSLIDAPLPGIGSWDEILKAPRCGISIFADRTWSGWSKARERIYLDRFWNELSANPKSIDEATRPTTPSSTRDPARCIPLSISSPRSTQDASTTRRLRSVSLRRA